jgi:hypothetical protein
MRGRDPAVLYANAVLERSILVFVRRVARRVGDWVLAQWVPGR